MADSSLFWLVLSGIVGVAGFAAGRCWQIRCRQADERIRHLLPPEEQEALLQGLQGLTLQIHAISEGLPAGDDAQTRLREVLASADHLMAWGDGSLSGQTHASDSQTRLAQTIAAVARECQRQHPLSFHLMVQGARQRLSREAREVVEEVSRLATARACLAVQAQRLCVDLLYLEALLCIRIQDDGQPDPSALAGVPALGEDAPWQALEARVKQLGGQLEFWPRPTQGTELVVVIPAASAYLPPTPGGVRQHIARWITSLR